MKEWICKKSNTHQTSFQTPQVTKMVLSRAADIRDKLCISVADGIGMTEAAARFFCGRALTVKPVLTTVVQDWACNREQLL